MDKGGIPMFITTGPEFQCLQGQGQNSNVYKIGPDFQCLYKEDLNFKV